MDEVRRAQAAAGPPVSFAEALQRRVAIEQAGRGALAVVKRLPPAERPAAQARAWREIAAVDQDNTAWLKARAPADGWFRISRDGVQVTRNAFLIVQHSGDQAWRKEVLARMEPLARAGEVAGRDYALLYDGTAVAEGRPQKYGSQLDCRTGRLDFAPIDAPEDVDVRREAVGLEPLTEYARSFEGFGRPC